VSPEQRPSSPRTATVQGSEFPAGRLNPLGPVFYYDLIRRGRQRSFFVLRFFYPLLLLAMLVLMFPGHWESSLGSTLSGLGQDYFLAFSIAQLATAILLTPIYIAGGIGQEKEVQQLDFLLASDLSNREIVLGKVVSRLANLGIIIVAGLPVLCLTQSLGGVDPGLVLVGFVVTCLTMLGLAGPATLLAVYTRKPRNAMVLTYLAATSYCALGLLAWAVVTKPAALGISVPISVHPFWSFLVDCCNAGNLPLVIYRLNSSLSGGQTVSSTIPILLSGYAVFHGLVALISLTWAVTRFRAVALRQAYARVHQVPLDDQIWSRPQLDDSPMMWKEIFAEPGLSYHWLGRTFLAIIIAVSLMPTFWLTKDLPAYLSGSSQVSIMRILGQSLTVFVPVLAAVLAFLTLMGVAMRAAAGISLERERRTLESLLCSPLTNASILKAKWLGSILSMRWAWFWLILLWTVGVILGDLKGSSLIWLFLTWIGYAACVAVLGLWFSIMIPSTVRATMVTLSTIIVFSVLNGLVGCSLIAYSLSPPMAFAWVACRDSFPGAFDSSGSFVGPINLPIIAGLAFWCTVAWILWQKTSALFDEVNRPPQRSKLFDNSFSRYPYVSNSRIRRAGL